MTPDQGIELGLVLLAVFIYVTYNFWTLYLQEQLGIGQDKYFHIWRVGVRARKVWTQSITDLESEALTGAQTVRNAIMSASFMATTTSLIAINIFAVILKPEQIQRVAELGTNDWIVGGDSLTSATTKVALISMVLLLAFFFFAQCIRFNSHLTYFLKVVPTRLNRGVLTQEEVVVLCLRASLCFTVGLRCFYFFIPAICWIFGPTAMLMVTIVLVALLVVVDALPQHTQLIQPAEENRDDTQRVESQRLLDAPHQGANHSNGSPSGIQMQQPRHGGVPIDMLETRQAPQRSSGSFTGQLRGGSGERPRLGEHERRRQGEAQWVEDGLAI